MNSREVKCKNAEVRCLQQQNDEVGLSEEEKEAFEQLKQTIISEGLSILENLDKINEDNALEAIETIRRAYDIDPPSFYEIFSNEEIISTFLQLLQIENVRIPIFLLLMTTCYHTEQIYEIYSKNNIFVFLFSFLESLMNYFDSSYVKDVIRYCLRFASALIDLFQWMDENICNMRDKQIYGEEEEDIEPTEQNQSDLLSLDQTNQKQLLKTQKQQDDDKDLGDILIESHFLDILPHFCNPCLPFLSDECARLLNSLTDYTQLYPKIFPLLVPLALEKRSSLGVVLEALSKIIDNGCDEAINFVFRDDNAQFFDFLHEIIGEQSIYAESAIRLIESISSFNDDSIRRVGDLGFIQQFFEMIPEIKDNNQLIEAIFEFFENLTTVAESEESCNQIISLFNGFNFYDYCQLVDASVKVKIVKMYLSLIRITTDKEFIKNNLTPDMIDLICDVITTENSPYLFQIIITLRNVLNEFSEEEDFIDMIEDVLASNNINLDDYPFQD